MKHCSHYVQFECAGFSTLEPSNSEIYFAHSRILQALHLYNWEHNGVLGVSFPQYYYDGASTKNGGLGRVVRIFSDGGHLERFLASDAIKPVILGGLVRPGSSVLQTPSSTNHVRYIRVRDEMSAAPSSEILRTEARLRRRREEGKNQMTDDDFLRRREALLKRSRALTHPFVRLASVSNHHCFALFIKKEEAETAVAGVFSSYGLSRHLSTVPDF